MKLKLKRQIVRKHSLSLRAKRTNVTFKELKVRQVTFGTGIAKNWASVNPTNTTVPNEKKTIAHEKTSTYKRFKNKPPPSCFVCARLEVKHFLPDCEKFKAYSPRVKLQTVMDAKRCLICLSVEHFVRDCPYPSKCRKCGSGCQNKHSGALHDCYNGKNLGAAELTVETPWVILVAKSHCT